jgi:hypothetical protein
MELRSLLVAAGLFAASAVAQAAHARSLESSALEACAAVAAEETQATRLNVVRYVANAGRGSYEYWFNAAVDPAKKSYCRTRRGEVTQFASFDGRWTSAYALRPHQAAQAVSLAAPVAAPR